MGSLAKPGDPYVDPRGEVKVDQSVKPPSQIPETTLLTPIARSMKISSRRNMNEMPSSDSGTQTAINAILMYHLLGLTQNEIAFMLKLDVIVVQNLMFGSDFQTTFELLFNEIINVNSNSLQATISKYAHSAVEQIAHLHKNAKTEMVQLKASQDLADRAGLDAEVLHSKNSSQDEQGFKVVILEEEDHRGKTSIEISVKGKR